jgi:hypothetical protein
MDEAQANLRSAVSTRDLLRRSSNASADNQKRRGDITEFPTDEATR